MMLPVQSQGVTRNETATPARKINQLLQPNVEQSARVVNSRQDPVSPTLFRISLEIGNHRLDVMTNRPLAEGLTVLLSRDARGEVALRLPTPVASTPTPAQTQALNQLNTQANQFIAMIAPESRALAQQLLTQTQMTALVQPQVSTLATQANPALNRALSTANGSASSTTPTSTAAQPTSGAGTAVNSTSVTSTNPASNTTAINLGSAAAQAAAANQTPVETIRPISGNAHQGQQGQQSSQTGQAASTVAPNSAPGTAQTPQTATPSTLTTASAPAPAVSTAAQTGGLQMPSARVAQTTTQAQTTTTTPQPQASTPVTPNGVQAAALSQTNQAPTNPVPAAAVTTPAPAAISASTEIAGQVQTAQAQAQTPPPSSPTQTGITLARIVDGIDPKTGTPPFARATLNLGGETINIVTPRPLLAGQQIKVTRLNDLAVQIRILPPQPVKTLPAEVVEEMQTLLRHAMPVQAPLADSLNQMRALSTGQSQDAVGQIVRSLMGLFSLSPQENTQAQAKQVEQMMQQSGLFTENKLARQAAGQTPSVEDLRTRLGQLRRAAQEMPAQAREQLNALIDKAEARATHQQIHSARQWRDYPDGTAERYFRMDLPLQTPEGFKQVELELKEQRRPTSPTETQTNWTLNLHFDLDPIGAVDARVHLEDEWDMSISFWAESTRTTEMIRDRLEGFSAHLEEQGFAIDTINVRKGRAPNDLAPAISKYLVDVHT